MNHVCNWKALIRCGMSLDQDSTWNVGQLSPHLGRTIDEYLGDFGGEDVLDIAQKNVSLKKNYVVGFELKFRQLWLIFTPCIDVLFVH